MKLLQSSREMGLSFPEDDAWDLGIVALAVEIAHLVF